MAQISLAQLAREFGICPEDVARYEALELIEPTYDGTALGYGHRAQLRLRVVRKGEDAGLDLLQIKGLLSRAWRKEQ